jgi:hypothetical protein
LKHEINSLFSRVSKVHEKEFEVLPEAWSLLQQAHGKVFKACSGMRRYRDLTRMSDLEFEDFVTNCPLADYEKSELRGATDRHKYYRDKIVWVEIREAREACAKLNNYLALNSIFMGEALREPFKQINLSLGRLVISQEIGNQGFPEMFKENAKELNDISGMFETVEKAVQKRLALKKHNPTAFPFGD